MLNALRNWGKKYISTSRRPTGDQVGQTSQKSRDDRASMVNSIRDEITRLQHGISDLNDAMKNDGASDASANQARMAKLHQQLAQKQQELAKYQARI
jgi:hypothetical protein